MCSGFVKYFINSVSVLPSTQRYVYSVTKFTRHRSQTKIPKVEQNKPQRLFDLQYTGFYSVQNIPVCILLQGYVIYPNQFVCAVLTKRQREHIHFLKFRKIQILLFLHYLHIGYIGILICISTLRNNVRYKDNQKLRN